MRFHCLFEQSGTFRDVFHSYGHESWDYDIQNEYGKTDFQIDLFNEIEGAFQKLTCQDKTKCGVDCYCQKTIFDDMTPGENFIMAFFPCTYFSGLQQINFRCMANKKHPDTSLKSIKRTLNLIDGRRKYFNLWIKFCFICQELKIPTIIENPASSNNYLELFSPFLPSYKEKNRTLFGDKFIKPTNYFAINFKMQEKLMMFDYEPNNLVVGDTARRGSNGKKGFKYKAKERSEIAPRYANNFYKRFIENAIREERL